MNGDQSQAQICEVYRYDRFFTPDLVVWAHATDGCDVGTLAVCYLEDQFPLLLKCALTLLIVVLMLATLYVILGILLFAVNTP
ncbi:hypothetical protein U9I39_14195 [Lacticaseibacillus rhamnosus]|uniref:hypothetical protein n=1 Tax=Lacticaseibacillus rhamnosus TaxID=47715 RepID=UPI0031FE2B46